MCHSQTKDRVRHRVSSTIILHGCDSPYKVEWIRHHHGGNDSVERRTNLPHEPEATLHHRHSEKTSEHRHDPLGTRAQRTREDPQLVYERHRHHV